MKKLPIKIGFACMRHPQPAELKVGKTTLKYLNTMEIVDAAAKLELLALRNAQAVYNLVKSIAKEPEHFRMVRMSTDLWPKYISDFGEYDVDQSIEWLHKTRDLAKKYNVRLSFHPDQSIALASADAQVVKNSIERMNLQGILAKHVGATEINIHCWGRGGVKAFKENVQYLNKAVTRRMTLENDEFGVGLEAILTCGFPVVLDVHHHWVNTGRWPVDSEFAAAASTWYGDSVIHRRPKLHYSYPRDCTLTKGFPELKGSRTAARQHSDLYNNEEMNRWILKKAVKHNIDIMCEAKHKDLARNQLYATWLKL